jgi:hypothetical protein
MSYYSNIQGEFYFETQEDFEKFKNNKSLKDWMESFEVDEKKREVKIPSDTYRNLGRYLDALETSNMKGMVIWTSTDGGFEGGVIIDGESTNFELYDWASENYDRDCPDGDDEDDNYDEVDEWMTEVVDAFVDSYLNA